MPDNPGTSQALADFWAALDAWGEPAILLGGLAVVAHGHRRGTVDIDATLMLDLALAKDLLNHLLKHGFGVRIPDALAFVKRSRVLLLVHEPSGTPVDLSLGAIPFEAEAIAQGLSVEFAGITVRIPRLEDLLIFKLVAGRPRDLDDVEQLLLRNPRPLDLARVDRTLGEFCAVLEDETRLAAWREIKARVGRQDS